MICCEIPKFKYKIVKTKVKDPSRNYFNNEDVEGILTRYVKGGCVDVKLRDEIMGHAIELIQNVIRAHGYHNLSGISNEDLIQVAWSQIELTLYKFYYGPGHKKVFNMWSQIAKTSMLAWIKKEVRDNLNRKRYTEVCIDRMKGDKEIDVDLFIKDLRDKCGSNKCYLQIVDALEELWHTDEKIYEFLPNKLCEKTGLDREFITEFLEFMCENSEDIYNGTYEDVFMPDDRRDRSEDEN